MWAVESSERFRLAGINNQNFLMRDEATGSWWQQSTGEAVLGPRRGDRLGEVAFEEVTFGTWRREHPGGRVLAPEAATRQAGRYAPAEWEEHVARLPVVTAAAAGDPHAPRDLVFGLFADGAACAVGLDELRAAGALRVDVGGRSVVVVLADDGRSVRALVPEHEGRKLTLRSRVGVEGLVLTDDETGTTWSSRGEAFAGPLVGASLPRVAVLPSYWFDWKQQHPQAGPCRGEGC